MALFMAPHSLGSLVLPLECQNHVSTYQYLDSPWILNKHLRPPSLSSLTSFLLVKGHASIHSVALIKNLRVTHSYPTPQQTPGSAFRMCRGSQWVSPHLSESPLGQTLTAGISQQVSLLQFCPCFSKTPQSIPLSKSQPLRLSCPWDKFHSPCHDQQGSPNWSWFWISDLATSSSVAVGTWLFHWDHCCWLSHHP